MHSGWQWRPMQDLQEQKWGLSLKTVQRAGGHWNRRLGSLAQTRSLKASRARLRSSQSILQVFAGGGARADVCFREIQAGGGAILLQEPCWNRESLCLQTPPIHPDHTWNALAWFAWHHSTSRKCICKNRSCRGRKPTRKPASVTLRSW